MSFTPDPGQPAPVAPSRLRSLLPNASLASALGWSFGLISVIAVIAASVWFNATNQERFEQNAGRSFQQYATQISNELDLNLYSKLQWLSTTASIFGDPLVNGDPARAQRLLADIRAGFPEIEWVVVADPDGRPRFVDGDGPRSSVATRRWFAEGSKDTWVEDYPDAGPWDGTRGTRDGVVRLAGPIRNSAGESAGVIAFQLGRGWAESLGRTLGEGLRARRPIDLLLVSERGEVLVGAQELVGTRLVGEAQAASDAALATLRRHQNAASARADSAPAGRLIATWPDGVEYLAGWAVSDGYGRYRGIGWTVWVREPAQRTFAAARAQQQRVVVVVALFGCAVLVVGLLATRRLTRQLSDIARSADEIRAGHRRTLRVPSGDLEAARIGRSMQQLLDDVQARTLALEALNRELDARVAERTREVERLAERNRQASVERERLRMARDLHDTLAHSLMALLTQIRLMRRLATSDPQSLPSELARAEAAAQEGLQSARSAIAALRQSPVQEAGLGGALQTLAERLEANTGVLAHCELDAESAARTDAVGESLLRIAEEALRNVQRHAHAQTASIRVRIDEADAGGRVTTMTIVDDGVGFAPDAVPEGHFGLQGMREQAELIRGRLELISAPNDGTTVRVTLAE